MTMPHPDAEGKMQKLKDPLTSIKQSFIIAYMVGILHIRRDPIGLLIDAATPFSFLFILLIVSGGAYLELAVAGALVMALVSVGLGLGHDITEFRTEYKLQDIFVSSNVSSFSYMLGLALIQVLYYLPSLTILSVIFLYFSSGSLLLNVPLLFVTTVVIWASMAAIAFFVTSFVSHVRTANQTITALNIGLAALPPVFYSIEMLPPELRYVAYAIPTTHASLLMQSMMGLPTPAEWSFGMAFGVIISCLVGLVLLAMTKARWREK
jgi:ABC-2 type transport system permease protein